MKKHLTIICALLTLTAFASCGDSKSSPDDSEVPESSISETTTEEETELETSTEKDDLITVPNLYGMDYDKAIKKYKDTFAILSSGREESELKAGVIVSQDVEAGTTYEAGGNRPRIRVKLSNGKKAEEVKNENAKLTETCNIGEISFKIPNGYEKENNASDESIEAVTYKYDNSDMINIAKQPGASQFDWDNMDEETKKLAFQTVVTSALNTYFDTIGDLEVITINGIFAVKQNAVYSGTTIPLTAYAFVHDDNLYMFMFTNMSDTQQEIIDSIQFLETYKFQDTDTTTKKVTEPVTEPPTEKINEPPIIETANSFEPFTISGTGSTVIQDVNIPAEFVVYSATHNGTSNFIAHFYDCNDKCESLVNEIGNYSCTQIFNATYIDDSSSGMVEVNADGEWSITFSPVKVVVSSETSTSFSGYGANITGAFLSTGNMICTVSHDGSSNFIVHAYELTEDGDRQPVANEIGEYNGQCVIRTKKDTLYFFNVDADGNWTINVE